MNIKSGLLACALAAFAVQPVLAQDAEEKEYAGAPDAKSYGYTVLAVGLATPAALPWGFNWDIFGLDVNLLYGDCNKMYGLEVAGLANTARLDMLGIQASLGFNLANRKAKGAMVSCFNMCNRTTYGLSVDLVGMNREFYGWQLALGATFARRVHGFQTALLLNMTDELRGAQLGLVNYAATASAGFQVGLVNLIMDNEVPFIPIFNCYF